MRFFLVVALLWSVAYGGVSDTGTYETRVPVSVPAYYGIQPSISLAYSSSGGNGTAGVGWQLNAGSSVRRLSSTHGSPGYDLTDVYYIDGRELLPCSGVASASCSNGGTHAFRTETFQKVVFDSSANTWTVTGREGTQYIYEPKLGTTANSMTTFSWSLARVVDLARHIVTYSYFCDGGSACYPQLISYGDGIGCNAMPDQAPGAPVPGARIQLHWEERTDVITAATGRAFETLRYRLKAIEVKHAGKMIRAYRLRYAPGTTNDSSLLESVEEFGSDAVFTPAGDLVSALVSRQPTRTFASPAMTASMNPVATRTTATNAFDTTTLARTLPRTWPGVSVPLIEHNHVVADVDGDGRVDVTQWHTNSSCTQITLSTRLAGSALDRTTSLLWTSMQPQYGLQPSTCAWYAHRADLDGDGRHDLLFENWGYQSNGAYGLHVVSILSRGGGNWANPSPEQDAQISHSNKVYDARLEPNAASCLVGDYDGDRRDDLACQVDQLQPNISTLLSRGDGTMVQAGGTSMPVTGVGNKVAVIDINGDGRTDIVRVAVKCPAACVWTITTGIATGSGGFQFENQDTVVPGSLSYDEQWRVMAGDIDGDGHGDFAIFLETAVPAQPRGFAVFTGLSRGRGAQRWSFAKVASGDLDGHGGVALADGDGDGADDLMLALLHHGHTASRCGTSISHAHYSFWLGRSLRDGTFAMSANMNAACGVESTIAFITNGHTLGTPRVQHTYAVDTNGDRKADWLSVAPVGNEIDGYVNLITDEPALNGNADPTRWQRADLDGDGREDWVYVGYANPGFQVFAAVQNPGGTFAARSTTFAPQGSEGSRVDSVRDWFVADVGGPNGEPDGKSDVVIIDDTSNTITTLISVPQGWTRVLARHWLPTTLGGHWTKLDFDGDGRADLAKIHRATAVNGSSAVQVSSLRANGDGTWRETNDLAFVGTMTDNSLHAFRSIDFDGNGLADLVHVETQRVSSAWATRIRTLRSRGDGVFLEQTQTVTQPFVDGHRYIPIDVNGDGRIDLARAKGTPNNPIVVAMLSVGDGTFALPTSTSSASSSMTTWDVDDHYVPGDLDQDGSTDFYQLVASPTAPTATLVALWNRSGAFAIQSYPGLPLTNGARNVRSYVLGDVGGDGRPDFTRISDGMLDQILLDVPGRRMTEERSGIGGRSTISYTTSTATGGNLPAGAVLPIVASVTSHDDITQQILDTTTYGFDDAVYDHRRRQLLGYRNGSTSTSRARTRTTYAVDDRCGARSAISTLETPTGAVLTRVTNSFVTNTTAPHVCLVASAVDEQCEGTGVCRRLGHTTTYDVYGNAVRVWQQGDLSDPLDDRLDESPVHPDTAKYIVSLPAFVNVSEWNRRWTLIKSTQYAYDGNGQLTSDGRWNDQNRRYITSQIVYDSTGNAIESRGPRTAHAPAGQKTTIAFDCTFQRFPERTCSGGACTTTAWNLVSGLPRSLTDENNETTTKTYDPLGRLIRTDLPVTGRYMRVDYLGAAGTAAQRIRIESSDESSDGVKWRETYFDGLGRPTKTIVEGGATNEVVYDAASTRIARHSTPYRSGDPVFWTESFYDSAGRATEIKLPDGKRRRTVFSVGAVATIDETGATTVTTADGYGRIAAIEEQLRTCQGGDNCTVTDRFATTYGYDVLGRMTWIRNAALMWTTNRYDSLSRRLEHCSPDEGCVATTYADDDLVESEVDVAGHRTLLKYDERGRPTERQVIANGATERTVTYTYVGGHLVEEIDTSDITRVKQLTWGAMGNIDRERTCIDGRCAELAFRYDRGNRLSEITYPDAKGNISAASPSFGYLYDDAGHLLGIPGVAVYAYDAAGHTTLQAFANAVFEQRAYDARRGWTDRIHVLGAGGDVLDVQLGHDPIGRVASASFATTSATSSFVYSHDDLGRMTSARTPTSVVTYRYDAINRRVWDSVHGFATYGDPLHPHAITRLDTGERYHYDVKGQLERSDALELRWNADGNPVEIRDANGVRTMYSYSADGERIAKRTNAGTERTFGDLVEIDSNGNLAFYIQANGKSIARVDGSGIEYFHRDHLDSIRATTDSSGRVTSDVQFGVWGERVAAVGAHRAPFGFVGARTDDNTGLVLLGARYYDPALAQMASPDSILPDVYAPQLLNPFAYAMNDPASLADPSGHSPEGESQLDTSIARPLFYAAEVLVVARIDAEASSNSAVHSIPVYSEDRPPPGLPSEPPPTDYATWQAQQSIYAGLTPEAQDAWKSTHFDDLADSYINPWVRDLTSTVRWALMFDPTGLGSMKLDDVDEEMQWGDSSNGNRGVQDLMGMMAPTKLGIGAIAKVGRAATAKKRFDGVMVLEISTARIGGAQNKKLVLQKFTRANQALRKAAKEGVHYRAFSDAFSYSRNASKRFLREYFGLDVPLDSFTITSIIGKGNVDEIISRWLGGPQLMHNQHILPGFINQYLGSAEWSAIRRLGVKKGDPVTHYEIIFKD